MTECKQCGKCCEAIILAHSPEEIKHIALTEIKYSNFNFALRNFIPITQEQAYKINPYLKEWRQELKYFYICRRFDPFTRKCKVYSARPATCSEYPWYGKPPKKQSLYSPDCSFQKDLKNIKNNNDEGVSKDDTGTSNSISS